jgi:dATP pyrophosphohydrolase
MRTLMPRAPFNVLVVPFRRVGGTFELAVFQRADDLMWQFVAGGGDDAETPLQAAQRECHEEAGFEATQLMSLKARAAIPRGAFPGGAHWPAHIHSIPEFCFAVDATENQLRLSPEHKGVIWLEYNAARQRLTWESNRTALHELRERLQRCV